MARHARKWFGLICAIFLYYTVHEGAHLCAALLMGTFQGIRIMGFGLGVQIVANTAAISPMQMVVFCMSGAIATLIGGYVLVCMRRSIWNRKSKVFRAIAYYTTLILLILDPLYFSVLHNFVGGGDMNGITQLGISALSVSIVFLAIGAVNLLILFKIVYKDYRIAFAQA